MAKVVFFSPPPTSKDIIFLKICQLNRLHILSNNEFSPFLHPLLTNQKPTSLSGPESYQQEITSVAALM